MRAVILAALLVSCVGARADGFNRVSVLVREDAGEPYTVCTYSDGSVVRIEAFKPCPQFRLSD